LLSLEQRSKVCYDSAFMPVEGVLCWVEKATGALPKESAEEVQQEMLGS
jgi:hypothetical protein